MKLAAALLLASAVIVGLVLWRRPSAAEPRGASEAPAVAPAADVELGPEAAPPAIGLAPEQEPEAGRRATEVASAPAPRPEEPAPAAEPARLVRGRVLDAQGAGVAGVELALAGHDGAAPLDGAARCTSGPRGSFEIAHARGAGSIVCADPRWITVLAGSAGVRAETEALVVIAPPVELGGLVVDEDGAPLAGAALDLALPRGFGADWGLVSDFTVPRQWSTRSDGEGRFALGTVPAVPGTTLAATLGGYETRAEPAPLHTDLAVVLVLARPREESGLVRGVVLGPDGAPVAGAKVSARDEVARTDRAGEFALDVSSPATRPPLRALARGYQPATFEPELGDDGRPRWPERVVLRLGGPPSELRGRVVDADGKPVGGARVWLDDATSFGQIGQYLVSAEAQVVGDERFWSYVESGADGAFVLPGLLGREYRVEAIDTTTLVTGELEHVTAASSPVEVVLRTRDVHPRVAGRVVSRRGAPVPGVEVLLMRKTYEVELGEGHQNDAAHRPPVFTGEEGEFEFVDVPDEGVGILVTGDAILFTGTRLKDESDVEDIEIVATVRMHLQVELDAPHDRADRVAVLDRDGRRLTLNVMQGEGATFGPEQPLIDGRSAVLALDEDATTLVLLRGAEEVARVPIALVPGETNVVRY